MVVFAIGEVVYMMYPNAELMHANRMMSRTLENLQFHVRDQGDEIIAILKTPEDAAMLIGCLGDGCRIQHNGKNVWIEGEEQMPASESYDNVAEVVYERIANHERVA